MRLAIEGYAEEISSCVISPDGCFIAVVGRSLLEVFSAVTGETVASLPLPDSISRVAFHPWKPLLAIGGGSGNVYLVDLIGINYNSIIVTAVDNGNGSQLCCPQCSQLIHVDESIAGSLMI